MPPSPALLRFPRRAKWLWLWAVLGLSAGVAAASPSQLAATEAPATSGEALSPACRRAYAEVLKLRVGTARQLLQAEPTGAGALLVANCADFLELLVSQDAGRYERSVAAQEKRLDALDDLPAGALRDYARAEVRLHLGISQLMFKHEVVGCWNLRQGFQQTQDVVRRYPSFWPARKTLGIGQFAVGSLPEGYHWLLRLLGLSGDVESGLKNLNLAAAQSHDFQTESQVFRAVIRENYYQQPAEALTLVERLHGQQPDNLLFGFLRLSLNKREHRADAALAAYRALPTGPAYLPVPYLHHMVADLLLYQGNYAASEAENQRFLRDYQGRHYRKDAAFKLYLAAWLGGQPGSVMARYRALINQPGPTDVEEDNYAQRFYDKALSLNPVLTRARLQTDGGYFRPALATLAAFRAGAATPLRDQLEAPYRRARAYHELGQLDSARLNYERTLAVAHDAPYYFAPQAALQLGYLCQAAGQRTQAKLYFEQALHYPAHEYKNSTDAKAALALRTL